MAKTIILLATGERCSVEGCKWTCETKETINLLESLTADYFAYAREYTPDKDWSIANYALEMLGGGQITFYDESAIESEPDRIY